MTCPGSCSLFLIREVVRLSLSLSLDLAFLPRRWTAWLFRLVLLLDLHDFPILLEDTLESECSPLFLDFLVANPKFQQVSSHLHTEL